jgi:8-oxo-dGTP diphosphatase
METEDKAKFHIVLVKGWVERGGKFLLAKRGLTELQKPGTWSLPGGKVESVAEEPDILQKTLKKEILEEVGVEIEDYAELIFNNSFVRVDGAHVVSMTFLCRYKSGEAMPLDETAEVRWMTLEELKNFADVESFLKIEIDRLSQRLKSL